MKKYGDCTIGIVTNKAPAHMLDAFPNDEGISRLPVDPETKTVYLTKGEYDSLTGKISKKVRKKVSNAMENIIERKAIKAQQDANRRR